ncbi:MAG: hypothetical protein M1816_000472 [Peltula sp. TS41687]|nr:MAG: hypothetical protein M1816_000472 [Peltula sp. TS41687]
MSFSISGADYDPTQNPRDLYTQLVISTSLGLVAFISFCILRPRWSTLYAARKRQTNAASSLPELPDTLFGWIPVLYKITEKEVLLSAGLDAYVFLAFFRMAIKFLAVAFLVVLVIMTPISYHYRVDLPTKPGNGTEKIISEAFPLEKLLFYGESQTGAFGDDEQGEEYPPGYFWMHAVFVYVFTCLVFYLLDRETAKVIRVRQDYLGSQSTITDRTIRLSGIPRELQSEDALKDFIEKLEIGKVDSITLCRDWAELDQLMEKRANILRKLEEAWTVQLGRRRVERSLESLPIAQPPPPDPLANRTADEEGVRLLGDENGNPHHPTPYVRQRPTTRIRYGFLHLQSKQVDAIDYYTEKLRRLDEKIRTVRQKDFKPTPLAFVTLDSIAASQMAVQAILDPSPFRLLAHPAPAPSDVVWPNTYMPRTKRMIRAWSVTITVGVLTVIFSALLLPLAGLFNIDLIHKFLPGLADVLEQHNTLKSLVQTGLPTLAATILTVLVPYLYDWLSNMQGMISQAEVELSVISKNFFFTFFTLFLFFVLGGSATLLIATLKKSLHDASEIAYMVAGQLQAFGQFYTNLIVLQGLGLLPLRLLEFGSVTLYPIYLMGSKTPRDFAELVQPPVFSYGFYLPQTLLIFNVCIVYSVLPDRVYILFFGLLYFIIGYFTYKYQLLYAMDHNQHSTGRAWPIICYRAMLGLAVFQVAMLGWLALKKAFTQSAIIVPLIFGTIWFSYFYARTYEPLTKFIALSSIRRDSLQGSRPREILLGLDNVWQDQPSHGRRRTDSATLDEEREKGLTFTNPNLISPLEDVWIARRRASSGADLSNQHDSGDDAV